MNDLLAIFIQPAVTLAVGVFIRVVIINRYRSIDNRLNLLQKQNECNAYALRNINGNFKGFGESYKSRYVERWEELNAEDKVLEKNITA